MIKTKPRSSQAQAKAPLKKPASKTAKKVEAPAPSSKSRALVTQPQGGGRQVSTKVIDFKADARMGQENMTQADFAIPRLAILQDLSPQVQARDERHIEGAEPGDICDVVSATLFDGDEGILIIPVSYRRAYIEWVHRKKGGGFVQDRTPVGPKGQEALQDFLSKCDRGEKGEITTPSGNEVRISGEYFVFMLDEAGDYQPYVLNMGGTQMKKSRKWNTIMNQLKVEVGNGERINPAMFYSVFRATTIPERNDQGSWFGWQIIREANTVDMPHGVQTYLDAKEFRLSIQAGRVSVSQPVTDDFVAGATETDEMPM